MHHVPIHDVIGLLIVGFGIGLGVGFGWRSYIAEREKLQAERMKKAAERDARLERVRSVR